MKIFVFLFNITKSAIIEELNVNFSIKINRKHYVCIVRFGFQRIIRIPTIVL
jgi:hypothetical protein